MRKLGLDFGTRSLGIAISDPLNIIATGLENCRFEMLDFDDYLLVIQKYLNTYQIDKIIIGYPLHLDGNESMSSKLVWQFKKYLKSKLKIDIILVDERFTTKIAHDVMIKANVSRKKRKMKKDKIAAQLILQDYLNGVENGK